MRRQPRMTNTMRERMKVAAVELKRGPLTAYRLSLMTSWDAYTARQVLEAMRQQGDVVEIARQKRGKSCSTGPVGRVYALTARAEQERQRSIQRAAPYKGIPAARITIPQFRWGSTRQW